MCTSSYACLRPALRLHLLVFTALENPKRKTNQGSDNYPSHVFDFIWDRNGISPPGRFLSVFPGELSFLPACFPLWPFPCFSAFWDLRLNPESLKNGTGIDKLSLISSLIFFSPSCCWVFLEPSLRKLLFLGGK